MLLNHDKIAALIPISIYWKPVTKKLKNSFNGAWNTDLSQPQLRLIQLLFFQILNLGQKCVLLAKSCDRHSETPVTYWGYEKQKTKRGRSRKKPATFLTVVQRKKSGKLLARKLSWRKT